MAHEDSGAVELARVLDKDALEATTGPSGTTSIEVPASWLARGDTVELTVPSRLACARCEGGGCDTCERRGGLRIVGDEGARRVRLALPVRAETSAFVVRLLRPLGDDAGLEQLTIKVTVADLPSAGCERVELATAEASRDLRVLVVAVVVALLVIAAAAAWLSAR